MAAMAGLDACLVGVDHDVDAVADGGSNRFDDLEVLVRIGKMKTKLDRAVALREHSLHVFDATFGGADLRGCAVSRHAV